MTTFMYPEKFTWLIPDMKTYYILTLTIKALLIIQIVILIVRVWSYKNISKSIKINWTWLLLLFGIITSLIYIWKKDNELIEINNTVHNNS
jgi:hypothetical protein